MKKFIQSFNEVSLNNAEHIMALGKTYEEAVQIMADLNGNGWDYDNVEYTMECHRDARAYSADCAMQSDEDAQAEYEFETASENAWLVHAEYHPEQSDEMYREDMMGGY